MPTPLQRATAICDALVNTTATTQQKQRVQAAFGTADAFLREVRQFVISRVQQHEETSAREATRNQVLADYNEAP